MLFGDRRNNMRYNSTGKILAKIVLESLNVMKLFFRMIFPILPSMHCSAARYICIITWIFVSVASVVLLLLTQLLKSLIANMTGICWLGGLLRVHRLKNQVHLTLARRRRLILAWTTLYFYLMLIIASWFGMDRWRMFNSWVLLVGWSLDAN